MISQTVETLETGFPTIAMQYGRPRSLRMIAFVLMSKAHTIRTAIAAFNGAIAYASVFTLPLHYNYAALFGRRHSSTRVEIC